MNQRACQSLYKREQGKIQKPDVYGVRKKMVRNVLQRLNQNDDDDEFDGITTPIDSDAVFVDAAAKLLIQSLPPIMPPVCFLHQLYDILPNSTLVDKEIQKAVKQGTWRKIHIMGQLEDEILLMQTNDYEKMVEETKANANTEMNQLLDTFKNIINDPQYNQLAIKKDILLGHNITEKQIAYLIKEGFLLPHTQLETYWFTVRKQGQFISNIVKGRAEILRILKKRPSKDIPFSLLKCKRLHKTVFNHEFLMHDLIGSGRVEKYSSMGDLIRLTSKGSKFI